MPLPRGLPVPSGKQKSKKLKANCQLPIATPHYERLFPEPYMSIRQLSSRVVYQNKWMTVREDEIERDNGSHGIYGVIEKYDSAIILAIEDRYIYLVEQFRYPLGVRSIEFPQGSLERNDVAHAEIARDELQGETGLVAQNMECLGEIYIACGYANQKTYAFLATGLSHVEQVPDHEEHDLVVRRVSLARMNAMVAANQIRDAQTLAAWALYQTRVSASGEKR